MGRPRKTTERTVSLEKSAKIIKDVEGDKHLVVIEEETLYSFTNTRLGKCFFTRSNGKEDFFDGKETKEDIDVKTRKMLKKSKDYENGWIVEENEVVDFDNIDNKNTLSDSKLKEFIKKSSSDKIEKFITEMTSELAIKKMRDFMIELNTPSSLVVFCDFQLKRLEEEEIEKQKAPIDKGV